MAVFWGELSIKARLHGSYFLKFISIVELCNLQSCTFRSQIKKVCPAHRTENTIILLCFPVSPAGAYANEAV